METEEAIVTLFNEIIDKYREDEQDLYNEFGGDESDEWLINTERRISAWKLRLDNLLDSKKASE